MDLSDSVDIYCIARKEQDNNVEWRERERERESVTPEIRNISVLSDQNGEAAAADLDNNGPIWTGESFAYKYYPGKVSR